MDASQRSILSYLKDLASLQPEKPLLGSDAHWLSAGKVLSLVEHVATALRRMNISGATVAVRCTRTLETAILLFGLRAAGAVAVLIDPRDDVQTALQQTDAEIPVQAVIAQTGQTVFRITRGETSAELDLFALPPSAGSLLHSNADEPAFVIFTSGSTGKSKAVVLTEGNLVNNLIDSHPLGDYQPDDRALGALPLHHVFGLVLLSGAAVLGYGIFFPEKTDIASILRAIEAQRLTRMNGVPSLYLAMAEQCSGHDLSSLRAGFIGGAPITVEQFLRIERTLDMTLISVYGMSECIGIACSAASAPEHQRAKTVGAFYPMNTGKILRADGTEADLMEEGEICVTGPARMWGYYGHPMPREDLLHTGDLGFLDANGLLHLTGRKKDIIIRNGNNLSPRRIEQALLALPGVKEAIVVGIPDEHQGEVPAAMVVADAALAPLHPALAKNELPVLYHFTDHLPMTASGKPDRQKIREVLMACRNG